MSVINSALAQVRQLQPYAPGKPVEELERELGLSNIVKLASNENPLGCSARVKSAIERASRSIELYPDANAYYLKQRLAVHLGVDAQQITIGNGSNDTLDLIARTFLEKGNEAVFSQYAFLVYALVTQACGATARIAPALAAGDDQAFGHDLEAMFELINDKTRVVFIANPNNPTGNWLSRDALEKFLSAVPETVAVVVDEAYFEYVDEAEYPDCLQWLERYANLIVTRTFSKIYGLAGLRIGYAVSSSAISDLLNRVRQPFNGNSLALAAAQTALDDQQFVTASRDNNRVGLSRLQAFFENRNIATIRSAGNFITPRFGPRAADIYQSLLQRGIIVRPLANYDLSEFLRISVGSDEQVSRLIMELEALL